MFSRASHEVLCVFWDNDEQGSEGEVAAPEVSGPVPHLPSAAAAEQGLAVICCAESSVWQFLGPGTPVLCWDRKCGFRHQELCVHLWVFLAL